VSFDGTLNANPMLIAGYNESDIATWPSTSTNWQYVRTMRAGAGLADVKASSGDVYWQDRANNLVWLKVQGGLPYPYIWPRSSFLSDDFRATLKPLRVSITAK
jgi:hypothetical protein